MEASPLKVAVLMGGPGSEREISVQSGGAVLKALSEAGIDHVAWDVQPDALQFLEDPSITLFFIALHGEFGEDGQLQRILEKRGLLYTGSGPDASELAFDKLASKRVFERQGVPCPRAIEFTEGLDATGLQIQLQPFEDKIVVKPPRGGSSLGVQIVARDVDLWNLCRRTLADYGSCMVEQFIAGRELTVSILDECALPVIEVQPARPFYDYHAKYVDDGTRYLFDTLSEAESHALQQQALRCFEGLGLRHFGRIDFILSPEGVAYCLEANSIPGLTSHSLLPKAAQKAGHSMSDLCCSIVDAATRCLKTPSSARERAVYSPGKNGKAGDIDSIVDGGGCNQAATGPLVFDPEAQTRREARSSSQKAPGCEPTP